MRRLISFLLCASLSVQAQFTVGSRSFNLSTGGGPCVDGPLTGVGLRIEIASISTCTTFTTWPDTSGLSHNVTMSGATTCTTTGGPNGGHSATISGQHGNFTALTASTDWTVIAVMAPSTTTKGKVTEYSVTSGAFAAFTSTTDGADIGSVIGLGNGTATITANAWYQWAVTYSATSGSVNYYVNSTTDGTYTQIGTITNPVDQIFTNNSNSEPWSGKIVELIILQSKLSGSDIAAWQLYNHCTYGVS